jgi:L-methionine (R)-S-oxide reductase
LKQSRVEPDFRALLGRVENILKEPRPVMDRLEDICRLLRGRVSHYDWAGVYLVESPGWLTLGPYDGEPTEHGRIAFGRGICGQAAETGETFVVQDVSKESNYLSCSLKVRSEIVVPILREGKVLGELDIDSHSPAPFTAADREFLEAVCDCLSPVLP